MKKNKLFIFVFVFILFFGIKIDGVMAGEDNGFIVCEYNFSINGDSRTVKIGVANSSDKAYFGVDRSVSAVRDKLTGLNAVVSAFHKSGTSDYTCPQLYFAQTSAKQEDQVPSGCTLPDGSPCDPQKTTVYYYKPLTEKSFAVWSKRNRNKPVSSKVGASWSVTPDDEVEDKCLWKINEIVKAANMNSHFSASDDNYTTCKKNIDIVDDIKKWAENKKNTEKNANIGIDENENLNCSTLLGDFANVLRDAFILISVAGVVILIVLMISDFIKAITSDEDGALLDAFKKSKNRIIATIILLLLPILINFVINLLNDNLRIENGNIKVGNVKECNVSDSE